MNRDDERIITGMERQTELRATALAASERLGWKSGFGTEGAQSLLGIEQPLLGFLTTATLIEPGVTVDVSEWSVPLFEAEVAVRIDTELGPGATAAEAAAAIGAVGAAIELVDLGSIESVEEILGGNIFHRHVILGELFELDGSDLDRIRIAVETNGETPEAADPREVIGDLATVVAALADQADLLGDSFQPGDVVITGAAVPPAPVNAGDSFRVELNNGSEVPVLIA